jgi:hypothetical protein
MPVYSSVTDWLQRLHFGEAILESGIDTGQLPDGFIDFKLFTELTAFPFRSLRTVAHTLKIPPSTIWDHL